MSKRSNDTVCDINLLDQLIKDAYKKGHPKETILGENGLLKQLTKALVERCLETEMENHLGYEKNDRADVGSENRRNGNSKKTVTNEHGEQISLDIPRDRYAEFAPQLVKKYQTRLEGFDEKVIAITAVVACLAAEAVPCPPAALAQSLQTLSHRSAANRRQQIFRINPEITINSPNTEASSIAVTARRRYLERLSFIILAHWCLMDQTKDA
jgi:hypothetical protein